MTELDINFLKKALSLNTVQSPCLEVGAAIKGWNVKDIILRNGFEYFATDIVPGPSIDFVTDFENLDKVKECFQQKSFGSVIILNVLEHTFEPIKLLDNAFSVLRPKGTCIITSPCIWPLHNYPYDYWRINHDFYEQYVKHRNLEIAENLFEYLGFYNVKDNNQIPAPSSDKLETLWGKIIHRLFNTYGRGMIFRSWVSIGVVIRKP